jgi:hypothetical protein
MNLLSKYVFAPDAFAADEKLYPYLQLQRRGFNFFGETEDPDIEGYALQLQSIVYSFILNSTTMERINNTSMYGNTYSITEVVNDLVKAVFDADINKSVNLYRQNAQAELVKQLAEVVTFKSKYDYASRAAAFASLNTLQSRIKKAATTGDAQTKAHRSYLVYLIDQAMDTD